MQINDKKALRALLRQQRREMSPDVKKAADDAIAEIVIGSELYRSAEQLLVYVSSDIEVGTYAVIAQAFDDGKPVFAPRCISGTNEMFFFRILSFDDLESGHFGIPEPKLKCGPYRPSGRDLCITPALAFDNDGYRLGFGKGFYDRFLRDFSGDKLGICYDSFIKESVFRDSFDVPVDMIITENREIIIDDEREE